MPRTNKRARPRLLFFSAQAAARLARRRRTSCAGNAWECMSSQAQIVVEGVTHTYRPARGRAVLALSDVSLEVRAREFFAGFSRCGYAEC